VITVTNLNADNISSGTLTSRTVRTNATTTRAELAAATNDLKIYISGTEFVTVGNQTIDSKAHLAKFGTNAYTTIPVRIENSSTTNETLHLRNEGPGPAITISSGDIVFKSGAGKITLNSGVAEASLSCTTSQIVTSGALYVGASGNSAITCGAINSTGAIDTTSTLNSDGYTYAGNFQHNASSGVYYVGGSAYGLYLSTFLGYDHLAISGQMYFNNNVFVPTQSGYATNINTQYFYTGTGELCYSTSDENTKADIIDIAQSGFDTW
jgi:hypothetical protein